MHAAAIASESFVGITGLQCYEIMVSCFLSFLDELYFGAAGEICF